MGRQTILRLIVLSFLYDFVVGLIIPFPGCAQITLGTSVYCDSDIFTCFCTEKDYLNNAAKAIAKSCSCEILAETVRDGNHNCDEAGMSMVMSEDQIIDAGGCNGASASASSSSINILPSTATGNPAIGSSQQNNGGDSTSTNAGSNNDSPKSDAIALGCGIGLGLPAVLVPIAIAVWQRKRGRW